MNETELQNYRDKLKCSFEQIEECFEDYTLDALRNISAEGVDKYFKGASLVCMIGRGWEPVMIYLEEIC